MLFELLKLVARLEHELEFFAPDQSLECLERLPLETGNGTLADLIIVIDIRRAWQ
jgi:hypothetical protein